MAATKKVNETMLEVLQKVWRKVSRPAINISAKIPFHTPEAIGEFFKFDESQHLRIEALKEAMSGYANGNSYGEFVRHVLRKLLTQNCIKAKLWPVTNTKNMEGIDLGRYHHQHFVNTFNETALAHFRALDSSFVLKPFENNVRKYVANQRFSITRRKDPDELEDEPDLPSAPP
eukprot:maker-scaffold961_size76351-snap-gene-0.29 protein:Tk11638 transcript:maker-scaffold961_size76351-snap-gene-0.29-mRNA-1 annotation:"tripartite motif-containing protein 16-like"